MFFPTLLVNLCHRYSSCPFHCLTDWRRVPLSVQLTLDEQPKGNMQLCQTLKHSIYWSIPDEILWLDTDEDHLPTGWGEWKAKKLSSKKVQLKLEIWIDQWPVQPGTLTELEKPMLEEEIYNWTDTSNNDWKCLTPRPLTRFSKV